LRLASTLGKEVVDEAHLGWERLQPSTNSSQHGRTPLDHQPAVLIASYEFVAVVQAKFAT